MKKLLFKVLDRKEKAFVGTFSNWKYPKVGTWTKRIERKDLLMCVTGYHLTPQKYLNYWTHIDSYLFVAEGRISHKLNRNKKRNKLMYGQVKLVKCLGKIKSYKQLNKIQSANTDTGVLRCFPKKKKGK